MSHFSLKISQDNSFLRGFLFKKYVIFSLGFNLFKEEYNLCKEKKFLLQEINIIYMEIGFICLNNTIINFSTSRKFLM